MISAWRGHQYCDTLNVECKLTVVPYCFCTLVINSTEYNTEFQSKQSEPGIENSNNFLGDKRL